jgi:hypothetical protein
MTRRILGWDEQDAYTPWRRLYCYLSRAGAVRRIKRRTHRRERREGRAEITAQVREWEHETGGETHDY